MSASVVPNVQARSNDRNCSNCEELTQGTHFRIAPNNRHVAAERKNALRLLSAAKSLSVFGKKSQMVRRDFSRAVPETFAMVGWPLAVEVVELRTPRIDGAPRQPARRRRLAG